MAGIMTDMDGESESWDVDDEVMPKDIHEIAVHSLLLRNEETIRTYNADSQQIFSLNTEFNRCTNVIDITDEPTNSESKQTEQHRDYEIVHVSSKKLYVTNISYRTSQNKLWEFFAIYGQVRYCQLLKDHNGKSKGRGFVTFTDVETAEHVLSIESDDLYLDGRYLEVKPATWKKFNRLDEKQENVIKHQMIPAQDDGCICLIDALSDDVMLEVFAFLTLKELLLCERVCRRWKELCSRQLQHMKHLSFNFLKTRFITGFKPRHFDNLLKRVSPTIQSIDLSMMHTCLGNDAVKTIASHCPHLHSLNLSGLMITNSVLQHLANSCQLQIIKMNQCCKISDKGLWSIFTKCHQLKQIDVEENGLITGKSFRVAGGQLEKLSLARCTQLQDSAMSHLLSRCKQLKAINLSYCTQLSVHGIACVSQFHELEVLHISGSHGSVTMLELKHLNKLRELHLAGNYTVTEDFLSLVGLYCPNLRFLDISDTDLHLDHVKNLCECIQLKTLKANNLTVNKIGHDLIMEGSLLRVIHLRGCQGLTAADILYIVTVAQDLEELDICYTGLSVAALQIFENLQKSEPERKITLLAYDDTDLDDFTSDDEEDSADLGNAQSYLDGDDPLFAEQFELS